MTQSFNEWMKENSFIDINLRDINMMEDAFIAGAASRQAEVDEYKLVAETLDDLYVKEIVKNKELQKCIDDALKHLETHLFCELPKAIEILKGEQNEP